MRKKAAAGETPLLSAMLTYANGLVYNTITRHAKTDGGTTQKTTTTMTASRQIPSLFFGLLLFCLCVYFVALLEEQKANESSNKRTFGFRNVESIIACNVDMTRHLAQHDFHSNAWPIPPANIHTTSNLSYTPVPSISTRWWSMLNELKVIGGSIASKKTPSSLQRISTCAMPRGLCAHDVYTYRTRRVEKTHQCGGLEQDALLYQQHCG